MRERLLNWLVMMSTTRRKVVFTVAIAVTVAMLTAATRLTVDMRWAAMLPKSLPAVSEFIRIDEAYYQPGNMIVAISGPDAVMLEQITDEATTILHAELVCAEEVAAEECVEQGRYARYVYGKQPIEWITDHALRLSKPNDARRMKDIFGDPRLLAYLTRLNDDFESEYTDSENVKNQERQIVASLDAVQQFAATLDSSAAGEDIDAAQVERVVRDLMSGNPYMLSLDKTMSLMMVSSVVSYDDIEHMPTLDREIERIMAPLDAKYPDYRIERTGMTAVGRDEMDSIGPITTVITLLAMVAVFLLLVWNFRSLLTPILTLGTIVVGIIWSLGVIALALGQLNLFTVMIMVILLGLGIDFSLHLATRFHEEIMAGRTMEEAMYDTLNETGKGVITGALTTAAAFYTLMIAKTAGIFEFGFCAGTGVIVTLLAVLWLLPSLLAWQAVRQQAAGKIDPSKAHNFAALGSFAVGMGRWRYVVTPLILLLTAVGIWGGAHLGWEWNFNKLEPKGLRSVELQDEIIDKYKFSIAFSMLTVDSVEESRELRKAFREKSLVGEVDDISQWVSRPDFDDSHSHIVELREILTVPQAPVEFGDAAVMTEAQDIQEQLAANRAMLADEVDRLWANIVEIQALSIIGGQDRVVAKTTQLVGTRETRAAGMLRRIADNFLDNVDAGPESAFDWNSLNRFAAAFGQTLRPKVEQMARGDAPVTVEMVPNDMQARYMSKAGKPPYLMQITPKQNLYEREELELFQDVMSKVHPNITGMPQMIITMCIETIREGKIASMLAVTLILGLLLVDFRKTPLVAGLAFLPLICGTALMLGTMWLFGEKFNYVNLIALPVIIGIGVDDGVHYFHRLLHEGKGGLRRATTSVGRAMLMTSLTTMIGFGSLMFYMMEGMKSMGFALFVGVDMCFVVTITLLPALSVVFEKWIL